MLRPLVAPIALHGAVFLCLQSALPAADGGTVSIAEREIQRRSAQLGEQAARLSEAEKMLLDGRTADALAVYETTHSQLPEAPLAKPLKDAALGGWLAAALRRAQELANGGDLPAARAVLDKVNPLLPQAGKTKVQALLARLTDPDRYPPALMPQHMERVERVQKLLIEAASQHETGMFDKALSTYEDVLRIDPTNTAARRGMEKVERERARYFQSAYDHQRSRLLSEVTSLWENKPLEGAALAAKVQAESAKEVAGPAKKSGKDSIAEKLRDLRIAKIDFTGATLEEVIEYLRVRSRDIDPEGRGVDFVLNIGDAANGRPISLSLVDVPLEEVLRYAADVAGVTYRVEEFAVRMVPLTDTTDTLISRTYRVPPDFISAAPIDPAAAAPADPFGQPAAAAGPAPLRRLGAKEFLMSRGVLFPEGAGANYNPVTNMLIVRNTVKNLELVESLVDQSLNTAPRMAVIEVKIVEISSKKLEESGFDWLLGGFRHGGVELGGGTVGNQQNVNFMDTEFPANPLLNRTNMGPVTAGLRSSPDLIDNRTIDDVLTGAVNTSVGRSPGVFSLAGVLTDPQFQVVWRGMSQKTGVDLMSKPSVITKSGQPATVEVVREFIYPTEFDPPQIPTNVGGGGNNNNNGGGGGGGGTTIVSIPVTPTTPTAFETRNVGVTLNVEPVIAEDGRSIDLTLTPEYTEFDGFVNYGSPIFSVSPNVPILDIFGNLLGVIPSSRLELTPNIISQPIFSTKKITTSVKVYDGATVVLGGLVSDQNIMIDDKVPVLGSVPYMGKLFQSKVEQRRTKNLVMFVSVKVVDPSGNRVNRP
ncbi:MAG: type II and III secretion system protein [Prosthecobacter sp.]|jgi:general secretion pathway protein D|nr:type II and III secretion system protein [Prosthecobacter sp.]